MGNKDTFQCRNCGEVFKKEWSDEEAMLEFKKIFPDCKEEDIAEGFVCDYCYKMMLKEGGG